MVVEGMRCALVVGVCVCVCVCGLRVKSEMGTERRSTLYLCAVHLAVLCLN